MLRVASAIPTQVKQAPMALEFAAGQMQVQQSPALASCMTLLQSPALDGLDSTAFILNQGPNGRLDPNPPLGDVSLLLLSLPLFLDPTPHPVWSYLIVHSQVFRFKSYQKAGQW